MPKLYLFILSFLVACPAFADVLTLDDGTQASVIIQKGTTDQTYVLINGLVYATDRWSEVADGLHAAGATVIRYALPGQPENLRLLKRGEEPAHFATGLTLDDMVQQLSLILRAAHVTSRVHVVGLSYGASVAAKFSRARVHDVADTTFIAPLVVPVDEYNAGGAELRSWLDGVRFWEDAPCAVYGVFNPWLCTTKDVWYNSLYDSIYGSFLEGRIKSIPAGIDSAIYKKSIFHLVRAARDFDLKDDIASLTRVSMLLAEKDDAPLFADQNAAWARVPAHERLRFVVVKGAHHALPDEAPAVVVRELLKLQ